MNPSICVVTALVGDLPYKRDAINNHKKYCIMHGYTYVCSEEPDPKCHPMWSKPELVLAQFERGFDFVFWLDGDSFFTNMEKRLEVFAEYEKDIVVAGDKNDIANTGHIFFRNSGWSRAFLAKWLLFRQPLPIGIYSKFREITTHFIFRVDGPYFNDQPPFNMLLAGADPTRQGEWYNFFNEVNLYSGNSRAKHMSELYAPICAANLERANSLVDEAIRPNVEVVVQSEMNSYPWTFKEGDFILHCVGDKGAYRDIMARV